MGKWERILTVICAVLLLLFLMLGLGFWHRYRMLHQVLNFQPMRIMVDGVMYLQSGVKQERPEGLPDGTVTKVVAPHEYPQNDGEANFGSVGMAYWIDMGAVIVDGDQYQILRPAG